MVDYLIDGPALSVETAGPTLLLAHGAGAPMDSDFMNQISALISATSARVVRFEFPYMAARRTTGKKAPPPRADKLNPEFISHIQHIKSTVKGPLFIGGKSMGGRIATMVADECFEQALITGVICLGYPFHASGKPEKLRTEHLEKLQTPLLICQGERDALGTREEVDALTLSAQISYHWARDGNHDLRPRKSSGRTHEENLTDAAASCVEFMQKT